MAPEDPLLRQFLNFLAGDIASHPERLKTLDAELVKHVKSLIASVEVDLNAPLSSHGE